MNPVSTSLVEATDENFDALVKSNTNALLVTFGAPWCPSCRMMEPSLAELAADFTGLATVAKADVEISSAISARYGIRNIPTLLLFKDGQLVHRITGATPKRTLATHLDNLLNAKTV
jgi:thioredoxin 1